MGSGAVKADVYMTFFRAMGIPYSICTVLVIWSGYVLMVYSDFWLAAWSDASDPKLRAALGDGAAPTESTAYWIRGYVLLSVGFALCILVGSYLFAIGGMKASKRLHARVLDRLLRAPMSWYESTPSGRTLSRFSTDMTIVDLNLSFWIDNGTQLGATLFAVAFGSSRIFWRASLAALRTRRSCAVSSS